MAQTSTSVVQITVKDESGYTKTFNIDDPIEDLTLGQINAVLSPAFIGRWWLGRTGAVINQLESANYSTSTKTQIGGDIISVTPQSGVIDPTQSQSTTFTVEGATIQGYRFDDLTVTESNNIKSHTIYAILNEENTTITPILTITTTNTSEGATYKGTVKLVLIVNSAEISLDLTFNIQIEVG